MFEASHLQHNIVSGNIKIVSDDHHLPAFWSHPNQGGPFPALVLLHDYYGLTAHVRSQARRFAELGYYVIAPDLYGGRTADTVEQALALADEIGEIAQSHVTATLNALKAHIKCNSQLGLIGWGSGGQTALRTAIIRDDLRALVIFDYLPADLRPAELRALGCPLLALLAGGDAESDPAAVDMLRRTLDQAALEGDLVVYPDVMRGFFDDSRPTFHQAAAYDAWTRSLAFLNAHLDAPHPVPPDPFDPGTVY